jgi:hypothetical protein
MSRIRTVKPELLRHEGLFDAEQETGFPIRIAFVGLLTCCDREGRFKWRPRQLKLDALPYDNVDFSRVLDALITHGFLVKYEVDSETYGCIPSFSKHQYINPRESESELPPPPGTSNSTPPTSPEGGENTESGTREPRDDDASSTREPREADHREGERNIGREGERIKDVCAEQPQAAAPAPTPSNEPPVITLPLNKGEYPVTQSQAAEWIELYPAVDIYQELRNMRGWLNANPKKRKTRTGTPRFINAWLSREQDKGPSPHSPRASPQHQSKQQSLEARNQSAVDEWLNNYGTIIEGETDNVRH